MTGNGQKNGRGPSHYDVAREIQNQPHVLIRLAENSLVVAESLRDNYFKNTADFVRDLRRAMQLAETGKRESSPLSVSQVDDIGWADVRDEVVTFIDGGVGEVRLSSRVPTLLRVGSYAVRTGERQIARREQFGYYPMILGDLEGGSKQRQEFVEIVRYTAELLAGLSALERTPDLRVLMFHGPIVYEAGIYTGHAPFTEGDIDLFLQHYAVDEQLGQHLKKAFLREAASDIYPAMLRSHHDWSRRRLFEPVAWIAFLYRQLIRKAQERDPVPIIAGVVERGYLDEFLETILLERVFRGLRDNNTVDYFNAMYGRDDLDTPRRLLDRTGYSDSLLLGMLMRPGQRSEAWPIRKHEGLRSMSIPLPGENRDRQVNWSVLQPPAPIGFPYVEASYVHISETTAPIRVEVFPALGNDQIDEATRRAYLYARLLPGYGFPVGLDIVDKYAHVPAWLTAAYGKLIRQHLSVSLQTGEISDAEMRRLLIQAIYMSHRDWLFRPDI